MSDTHFPANRDAAFEAWFDEVTPCGLQRHQLMTGAELRLARTVFDQAYAAGYLAAIAFAKSLHKEPA